MMAEAARERAAAEAAAAAKRNERRGDAASRDKKTGEIKKISIRTSYSLNIPVPVPAFTCYMFP